MKKITVHGGLFPFYPLCKRELGTLLDRLLALFDLEGKLILNCVHDQEIAALNQHFLGCIGPTNILSFPTDDDTDLGELILSRNALARECILYGQPMEEHLVRLLAHGLLHLAGLDHGEEMYSLTELAVQRLTPLPS